MPPIKGSPLGAPTPLGASLYDGELGSPVAVIRDAALEHNASLMAHYCERHGVVLAPHAKTTMSPELVARQLAHGAWGMTVANPVQAVTLWSWGVERVLIANEVTDVPSLTALLRERGSRRLWFYVDSERGRQLAVEAVRAAGIDSADVLVELGHAEGRTGVRTVEGALALAAAVGATPELRLDGVAGYEGTLGQRRTPSGLARVAEYLDSIARLVTELWRSGLVAGTGLVTAGGSTFFDLVVDCLGPVSREVGARLVLRSGCYLTHDHGLYETSSPSTQAGWPDGPFVPAIEVWTRVLSRPEPDLLLLNAGRRDVSYDAGLPVPIARVDASGRRAAVSGWEVFSLGDQHAFVRISAETEIEPGDLVGLGISHPCTTFDKWSRLERIDDHGIVTGHITTTFG